jgi:hypothetical protein
VAVTMTIFTDGMAADMTSERFEALWSYAKLAGSSWPESQQMRILADAEMLGSEGSNRFADNVTATMKLCHDNLEGQQRMVDAWRELAKSGLLKSPAK